MLKIAYEAQRLFRLKKHGMDIVALEILKALKELPDLEITLFSKKDAGLHTLNQQLPALQKISTGWPYPIWEQLWAPATMDKKYDMAHFTSNTAPLALRIPYVLTLHDVIFLQQKIKLISGSAYQKWGNEYRVKTVPAAARRAKRIITVSHYEKQNIIDTLHINPERIDVVYNAVGAHFAEITDTEVLTRTRLQYKLPPEYIFFLGNTDPKKNLENTLRGYYAYVCNHDRPLPLVIADLSREYVAAVLRKLDITGVEPHLHFAGYILNTDLPAIYSQATLFLYTSLRESFGIPQLEAMACGTPVITSTTTALPEIAGNGALLVDPTAPEAIGTAISRLVTDADLHRHYTNEGKKRVTFFSWQNSANQVAECYRKACL